MEKPREDEKQMSAVVRTISILEALSEVESCNLENLSRKTDLPKATLLRFLSTLTALGYVYRDGADMYHLTLKMFSIGSRSLRHMDLVNTAKPFAKSLCQELGETVHMGILEDDSAVYVLKEESSYPLRMYSRVGKVIPLYCTAIGKTFLADMSEKELDAYLQRNPLKPFTAKSIKTPQALKDELERTRQRGWAIDVCIMATLQIQQRQFPGNHGKDQRYHKRTIKGAWISGARGKLSLFSIFLLTVTYGGG